jgi:hypothetical protein
LTSWYRGCCPQVWIAFDSPEIERKHLVNKRVFSLDLKRVFPIFCYFYVLSDQIYNKPINPFPSFHCETNKCKFSAKNLFCISLTNLFSKTKIRKQDKRTNKNFYLNFKKTISSIFKKNVFLSLDLTGPIIKMINFFRRSAY